MRTSYSAIETYLQCPQKYHFQEIQKLRGPKSREALFGTLVHSTLRFMFTADPLFPTLDEVLAHFREHWPSDEAFNAEAKHDPLKPVWGEEEQRAYFEQGIGMLRRFYERNTPWNFHVVDLESRFEVTLTDEKTGAVHVLAGIIDRIDKLSDEDYEIIDYKTGRRMPSQDNVDKNLQLSLYSLGLQKRWPHLKPESIKTSLYFLRHGEKLTSMQDVEAADRAKNEVLGSIREIEDRLREKKEFEPVPSPLCNWCAYRPMCPAWRHLYQKKGAKPADIEIEAVLKEYFELRKEAKKDDQRLTELQAQIKRYMDEEGLTRVFGDDGTVAKRNVQRYEYNFDKVKAILEPMGKWEDILKLDETRLKKLLGALPPDVREAVNAARMLKKEYPVLSTSDSKSAAVAESEEASNEDEEA